MTIKRATFESLKTAMSSQPINVPFSKIKYIKQIYTYNRYEKFFVGATTAQGS